MVVGRVVCHIPIITMGNSISSLVRNTNAWLHAPATLRGGYVLAWGMTFGFQVWQSFIGGIVAFKTCKSTVSLVSLHGVLLLTLRSTEADIRSPSIENFPNLLPHQYPPHYRTPHPRYQAPSRPAQKLQGSSRRYARRTQHWPLLGLDGRIGSRCVGVERRQWGVGGAEDDRGHV